MCDTDFDRGYDVAREELEPRLAQLKEALEIVLSVRMLDNLSEDEWRKVRAAREVKTTFW